MDKKYLASLLLRIGLAFVFIYAGISIFIEPSSWMGFIPGFVDVIISKEILLYVHGGMDILLGAWLLSNKKAFYASIVSSIFVFGIIIFNISSLDIIFRDVGILLSSLALAVLSKE